MAVCKVVVLISGSGSNLQALIDAASSHYTIASVISNNADAFGLQRANQAGIPTMVIDHREFASRKEFDLALQEAIDTISPDLLVLAGFMRILGADFVNHFAGRIINIHPSLLPKFQGTHTHERALEAGEKEHGASVHFVTEDLDGGPVIAQEKVAILSDDTAVLLKQRVLEKEHILYPRVVDWFAQGRLKMSNGAAWFDEQALPPSGVQA